MSALELAQKNMRDFLRSHDARYVAEDAVFINKATGERIEGRNAIGETLNFFYRVAFDAHAEITNVLVLEDRALAEGLFMGKHIGEFAGIPASIPEGIASGAPRRCGVRLRSSAPAQGTGQPR